MLICPLKRHEKDPQCICDTRHHRECKKRPHYNYIHLFQWEDFSEITTPEAFYDYDNYIQVKAGMLRGPVFNKHRPNYMNFGGIGFILGHEVAHGFTAITSVYDKVIIRIYD